MFKDNELTTLNITPRYKSFRHKFEIKNSNSILYTAKKNKY